MEDWYTLYKAAKLQQREDEIRAMNLALMKADTTGRQFSLAMGWRRALNDLGRFLETWGRYLQKRYQTC